MSASRLFFVFWISSFLQSLGMNAQDSVEFDPVEVRGERIRPSEPFRMSTLDSGALDHHVGEDLGALLEQGSALQVRRYGPSGIASLSFRGTRSNETRMYWNGLPLRNPTLGQSDLSTIPAFFLDRVELHHGGASAIDGAGGIGGSVHLRSRMPRNTPYLLSVQGKTASFGDRTGAGDFSYHKDGVGSRTRLFYRSAQNDFSYPDVSEKGAPSKKRKNADMTRMGVMEDLRYDIGNGHELFASGWYIRNSRNVPTPIDQVPRGQHQEDRKLNSLLGWSWTGSATHLSFRSGYFYSDQLFTEEISDLHSVTTTHSWRNRLHVEHRLDEKRSITGGWSYDLEKARSSGYPEAKQRVHNRGFLQFENRVGERLLLQGMLQEKWVDGERLPLMPTVGAQYKWNKTPDLKVKGNLSRTYRVPTLNDLYWEPGGAPNLSAQEGWSYEAGVSGVFGKEQRAFSLRTEWTAFLLKMSDRIVWAPTSTGYWSPKNIDRSRDRGIEGSFNLELRPHEAWGMRVKGNYSYVDAEVIDQVEGGDKLKGQAIYIPKNRASGVLGVSWKERTSLRYGLSYTGERFIDRDNRRYLPAYTIQRVDIQRWLHLRKDLRVLVRIGVQNLFDIPYQSVAWQPMPGRSFELTLRLRAGS